MSNLPQTDQFQPGQLLYIPALDPSLSAHDPWSAIRAWWRVVGFIGVTLLLAPLQALLLICRWPWPYWLPRWWHRGCAAVLGLRVRQFGQGVEKKPTLYVANHLSYLDITVLGSILPASFVAKAEIEQWPLFGWLAKLQNTIFIERRASRAAKQRTSLARHLYAKRDMILFPEGTSGMGQAVLPFKSTLFALADDPHITVQPVTLAVVRLDGLPITRAGRSHYAWYGGMDLAPHAKNFLGLGGMEIWVIFHPPLAASDGGTLGRKELALAAHQAISHGLAAANRGLVAEIMNICHNPLSNQE